MRSTSKAKRFALICGVSVFLIFGLDFFVTDNGTRGLQGEQDNKPESATDLAVVVELEEVLDVVPMTGEKAAQVDATDHLVEVVDGNELVSIETQKNGEKPIMHTFFEPVANGCCGMSNWGHQQLLKAWEASWQARGWETRILTKKDAENHPDFDLLQNKLWKLGVGEYNQRCFWRWLAMVAVGGGWMSDYDVFPLGLDSEVGLEIGEDDTFKSFLLHVPCLLHASAPEYDRIIHLMIDILPDERYETVSDMRSLLHLDQWRGRSGMKWSDDVTHIIYKRNEEGWQWIDCELGKSKLAVHLSHRECDIGYKEGRYPELEKMPKDMHEAIGRRYDAALQLMDDYKDKCIDME
jgi:hypothetical protein